MSSFGKVGTSRLKRLRLSNEIRALCADASALGVEDQGQSICNAASQVLAVATPRAGGELAKISDSSLNQQVALLRRMSRHEASKARKEEERAEASMREHLATAKELCGKPLALPLGPGSSLRTLHGRRISDVNIHDDIAGFVQDRVAHMVKTSPAAVAACNRLWEDEHKLLCTNDAPVVGEVPPSAKPSLCAQHGCGRCLCKGHGAIVQLAARHLAGEICRRAPGKSTFRKLLRGAWVVCKIGDRWLHCGLTYFKPRRPTFIEVDLMPHEVWGHKVVKPRHNDDRSPKCIRVYDALWDMEFSGPLHLELYRFVTFSNRLPDWVPERLLAIAPLSATLGIPERIMFWRGEEEEAKLERERQRKAQLEAARKMSRKKHGEVPEPKGRPTKPSAAPTPQQEAMARAAKAVKDAAVGLLPLAEFAAPGDPDGAFWSEWFEGGEDIGSDGGNGLGSDVELEQTLASLIPDNLKAAKRSTPSGVVGGDCGLTDSDSDLFGDSGEDGPGTPVAIPYLDVVKKAEVSSDDESPSYLPSSPLGGDGDGDKPHEQSKAGGESGNESDGPMDYRLPRFPHSEDRSDSVPTGCKFRKYTPPGKSPFWLGILPEGREDASGRKSRMRSYRPGLRSEDAAAAQVELWLEVNGQEGDDAPPESPDGSTTSSSSSSSDDSS